ncbi:hypothetical protein BMW23_0083 [Bodo saltans virus]|uniref:Uncharacterized protein n=1 Tax=Bodo saltans virus TaxID=2024608 RepID=A0A2H4UTJ7_9VIRU|nr:hypothetical protein QJ851_gp0082 [Bodo saltans virus]ATZ80145.1 hypothetical protein BMW23_0083 [Bodo saltans virus]
MLNEKKSKKMIIVAIIVKNVKRKLKKITNIFFNIYLEY